MKRSVQESESETFDLKETQIMQWIFRPAVFAAALLIGIFVGTFSFARAFDAVARWVDPELAEPVAAIAEPFLSTGVQIKFAGWETTSSEFPGARLKFTVYNGTFKTFSYRAHYAESAPSKIEVNGFETRRLGMCGTGMQDFYVFPGQTAEFHLNAYEFLGKIDPTDSVDISFHLYSIFTDKGELYRAEPFTLPEEFRQIVNRNARD